MSKAECAAWRNMWARCTQPSYIGFHKYGGRGIAVCDRWLSFENFLADMGPRPDGMSLDRKDNDKGYSPENCRWATRREQQRNTSRNMVIELDGCRKSFMDWCDVFGINSKTVRKRLQLGWSIERAFREPVKVGHGQDSRDEK